MDHPTRSVSQFNDPQASIQRRSRRRSRSSDPNWGADRICTRCVGGTLSRVHRESFFDFILSCFGSYPFICNNCHERSNRVKPKQFLAAACLCAIAFACLAVVAFELKSAASAVRAEERKAVVPVQNQTPVDPNFPKFIPDPDPAPVKSQSALTNQDVISMVKGGMSSSLICDLIGSVENKFVMDAQTLVELKKAHVPENVILSMVGAAKGSQEKEGAHTSPSRMP